MKKILCFIESLCSGGAERQLCGLAILLKQRGYDVKVVTYVENQFYEPQLRQNGVKYELNTSLWNKWLRPWRMAKLIRREKADVVISFLPMVNMATCLAKSLYNAKLIVGERNTTQQLSQKDNLLFWLYRFADVIVPNAFSQEQYIKEHFPRLAPKIRVITNFVDTELFRPSAEPTTSRRDTRIICVGRLMPQKNILSFIEAVNLVAKEGYRFHVDWFGQNFQNGYAEQCFRKVEKLHLNDIFLFHEPSRNIVEEYRNSDIFCLPSIYEGFPNVLCEAMSCGLPVICSDVCDNPMIVCDGENGFMFNPQDVSDMARIMTQMLNVPSAKRDKMIFANREKIINLCSMEAFVNKYIALF